MHVPDQQRVNLVAMRPQEVSPEPFAGLRVDDMPFVDSSHVVKAGSEGAVTSSAS